jgi:hypothetical protein
MNNWIRALACAAALPLGALAADKMPTLEEVAAAPPPVELEFGCAHPPWPTQRQVERYTHATPEAAAQLRHQVLTQGRRLCWQGYTHVQVEFSASRRAVVIAGR